MLDDDKIGFVKQLNTQRNSLHRIGPTTRTQMYSPNAAEINRETSMWKQFSGIIEITRIKMIANINCRIVLGLVKSL